MEATTTLALRQIFGSEHEPRNALPGGESFDDLGHVGQCDAAIEKVIRLHQDGDTGRALIEATGSADARLELGESARLQLFLQGAVDCLGTARCARSFFVIVCALIHADEEVMLPLRHDRRLAADRFGVNRLPVEGDLY